VCACVPVCLCVCVERERERERGREREGEREGERERERARDCPVYHLVHFRHREDDDAVENNQRHICTNKGLPSTVRKQQNVGRATQSLALERGRPPLGSMLKADYAINILCITFGKECEACDAAVDQFAWDLVELPLELENHRCDCVDLLPLTCAEE
jgi:hypothetical protein